MPHNHNHNPNLHGRFIELAAIVTSDALTREEAEALSEHLLACDPCRELYREYLVLARDGFALLPDRSGDGEEAQVWGASAGFEKLLKRIEQADASHVADRRSAPASVHQARPRPNWRAIFVSGLAAGIAIVAVVAAYHLGASRPSQPPPRPAAAAKAGVPQDLLRKTQSLEAIIASQTARIAALGATGSAQSNEVNRLKLQLEAVQERANDERAAAIEKLDQQAVVRVAADLQLRDALLERDRLSTQLRQAGQALQNVHTELANLRAEHEKARIRMASLEAELHDAAGASRDQERRLKDLEQYVVSNVEVRELIGARNLYIADVFDVDSNSRTQKPFGRVFYTRGKSLVFYAFDLDQRRGVKGSSAFQVWGQRVTSEGQPVRPLNLGILYLDSEPNRRWLLRFDDPRTLAEIGAIFVTVEPNGGSTKPTSKPFLFAMLRKEANHP